MNRRGLILLAVALFVGCSSHNSPQNADSIQKNDLSQKADSADSQQKIVVSGFGCNISQQTALRLCNEAVKLGKANRYQWSEDTRQGTGDSLHPSIYVVSRGELTVTVALGVYTPDLKIAAGVLCQINTAHSSIVYANLTDGPHDQKEADYLRSKGLCSE